MSTSASDRITAPSKAAPAVAARARKRLEPGRERSTILTVALLACSLYFLLPLVWLAISATKSNADLFSTFGFAFGKFNLFENIQGVFTYEGGIYTRWLLNTVFYALTSAVGAALLSAAAGFAFAKYEFPGRNVLFSSILGAVMIPTTALAIPTYLLFAAAGITNSPVSVILPSLVSPFGVYLMRVYAAASVPSSLLEAARIDGASEFRVFWQVSFRMMAPGVVTVFLFALVATWNNYFLPLIMLTDSNQFPVTLGLAQWQSETAGSGSGTSSVFADVVTGSFISVLPLIIAFLYLQRYWQTGLSAGSVKE